TLMERRMDIPVGNQGAAAGATVRTGRHRAGCWLPPGRADGWGSGSPDDLHTPSGLLAHLSVSLSWMRATHGTALNFWLIGLRQYALDSARHRGHGRWMQSAYACGIGAGIRAPRPGRTRVPLPVARTPSRNACRRR